MALRAPLLPLGISASVAVATGGLLSPLPFIGAFAGAAAGGPVGGFRSLLALWAGGAGAAAAVAGGDTGRVVHFHANVGRLMHRR